MGPGGRPFRSERVLASRGHLRLAHAPRRASRGPHDDPRGGVVAARNGRAAPRENPGVSSDLLARVRWSRHRRSR
jgi:hypothetical protein